MKQKENKSRTLFIIFLSLFTFMVSGQTLNFQYYNSTTGFPSRRVWSIFQDQTGIMWFGDLEGLLRYDGGEYKLFQARHGLPGAPILSIGERVDGLYIGTPNGLAKFNGGLATKIESIPSIPVRVLYADQLDQIWVGSGEGLYLHGKSASELVLPDEDIRSLFMYKDDLYVGTYKGDLLCIKNPYHKELRVISTIGSTGKAIRGLIQHQDTLYVGSNSGVYQVKNDKLEAIDLLEGQPLSATHMVSDGINTLWIGTWGKGLLSYNTVDNSVHVYGAESGIPSPFVTAILCDDEKNLWFSFFNGGVIKYSDRSFLHYPIKGGIPITRLNIDSKGTKWLTSTKYGLLKIPPGSYKPEIAAKIILDQPAYSLFVDSKDRIWILQPKNIYRMTEDKMETVAYPEGKQRGAYRWVFEDSTGRIWLGGPRGIAVIKDGRLVDLTPKGDPKKRFWHGIERQDNSLLFSSVEKLWAFKDGAFTEVPFDKGESQEIHSLLATPEEGVLVGTTQGLYLMKENGQIHEYEDIKGYNINRLFQDSKGRIWAGSRNGIWIIDGLLAVNTYRPETTMGGIENIIEDSAGSIWFIAHNRNVTFDGQNWKERMFPSGFTIQSFNPIPTDSNGVTWFATNKGLTSYSPRQLHKDRKFPEIKFCNLVLKEKETIKIHNGDSIDLMSNQNGFTLWFGSNSFINEKLNRYDVKIEGPYSDKEEKTLETQWDLMNLPPGNYTVSIMAYNGLNQPAQKDFTFDFSIKVPFWKTNLFLLLMLGIIIMFIYYIIRYLDYRRIVKLQKRNEWLEKELKIKTKSLVEAKKKETASALTVTLSDEIAQPLMSIQGNLDLLRHQLPNTSSSNEIQVKNIQEALIRIRDVMIKLRELDSIEFDEYTPGIQMVSLKEKGRKQAKVGNQQGLLFVDDENELLEVWKMYFETLGYRVFIGSSVDDGLAILEAHAQEVHVIISDNKMPGKTGFDFYHRTLEKNLDIPFYILTGFDVEPQLKEMLNLGLKGIIQKPIMLDTLHDIINNHLA